MKLKKLKVLTWLIIQIWPLCIIKKVYQYPNGKSGLFKISQDFTPVCIVLWNSLGITVKWDLTPPFITCLWCDISYETGIYTFHRHHEYTLLAYLHSCLPIHLHRYASVYYQVCMCAYQCMHVSTYVYMHIQTSKYICLHVCLNT